jgi:hypothetical protein
MSTIQNNEIRDYLERAPKRFRFDGRRMVNYTHQRFTWLASLARGTIDEKINRRAGAIDRYRPFHNATSSAYHRHIRRVLRISGCNWSPF